MSYRNYLDEQIPDHSVTGWNQDHILAQRNSNRTDNKVKNLHRKQLRAHRRKYEQVGMIENIEPLYQAVYTHQPLDKTTKYPEISNIGQLKRKIKLIDKDSDRWDEHFKLLDEEPDSIKGRGRTRSEFIKVRTENNDRQSRESETHKSIQNTTLDGKMRRPMSSQGEHRQFTSNPLRIERSKTIHSKTYLKTANCPPKQKSEQTPNSLRICINQLQSGTMRQILKCLGSAK